MLWPSTVNSIQTLPELPDLATLYKTKNTNREASETDQITYQPSPNKDPIIGSASTPLHRETYLDTYHGTLLVLPYVVITYRGLYLFDSRTGCAISSHIRSDNSVEQYGSNVKVRISPNGRVFAIETSRNVMLIYSIRMDLSDEELLTIYNSDGFVLQNGFPLARYREDVMGRELSGKNVTADVANGIFQTLVKTFKSDSDGESPVIDFGLRLRLILKVQSRMTNFFFVSNDRILLVSTHPVSFQTVSIRQSDDEESSQASSTKNYTFTAEDLPWYDQEDRQADITNFHYYAWLKCMVWINALGHCWLVTYDQGQRPTTEKISTDDDDVSSQLPTMRSISEDPQTHKSSSVASHFHGFLLSGTGKQGKAVYSVISPLRRLCYIALSSGAIQIYSLVNGSQPTLLKTVIMPPNTGAIRHLTLAPRGDTLVVQFSRGWAVYSSLGNLNFSTLDYDSLMFSLPNNIRFIDPLTLVLTFSDRIVRIGLTCLNFLHHTSAQAVDRPVLINSDTIHVFRGRERKLPKSPSPALTESSRALPWATGSIPLVFRFRNTSIRCCCASEDGSLVCLVGNRDVGVFNLETQVWKLWDWQNKTLAEGEQVLSPVVECLWLKNTLLLALTTQAEQTTSQVLAFPEKCWGTGTEFSPDSCVWQMNLTEESKIDDEQFVTFGRSKIGSREMLLVATNHLNVYSWSVTFQKQTAADTPAGLGYRHIVFERSRVYQLSECFGRFNPLQLRTIVPIDANCLVLQFNTSVYVVNRLKDGYHTRLLSDRAEYIQKLGANTISVFDGSKMVHHHLDTLQSVDVNVGNDIALTHSYTVHSSGATPYPLTTVSTRNLIVGLEVDCISSTKIRLQTTQRDYLDDIVDNFIVTNIDASKGDSHGLGLSTVYQRLHKLPQFKYVLELLTMKYAEHSYDDEHYDSESQYFSRLMDLINMTGKKYEILLNCVKKIEPKYWPGIFARLGETPSQIVDRMKREENYKLAAHYFTIMLNEQEGRDEKIALEDVRLIQSIILKLATNHDYETCFEMLRYIKLVDADACHTVVSEMEKATSKLT